MSAAQETRASSDEIMTLAEISTYLKVSERAVLRMVKAGDMPEGKVSSRWRSQRTLIENWMTAKIQSADSEDLIKVIRTKQPIVPLPRLITPEQIILDIKTGTKESVLRQMIQPLINTSKIHDSEKFLSDLLNRENMISTAVGDGIAIPHVRDQEDSEIRRSCIVLGLCKRGADFDSLDGNPTHLFFLICARTTVAHLRLLAKITLLLRKPGVVAQFCSCSTKGDAMALLTQFHFDLSISF